MAGHLMDRGCGQTDNGDLVVYVSFRPAARATIIIADRHFFIIIIFHHHQHHHCHIGHKMKICAFWRLFVFNNPVQRPQMVILGALHTESQKPRQRVSNADQKVFANRKVFATSSLLAEEFPNTLQYKIFR